MNPANRKTCTTKTLRRKPNISQGTRFFSNANSVAEPPSNGYQASAEDILQQEQASEAALHATDNAASTPMSAESMPKADPLANNGHGNGNGRGNGNSYAKGNGNGKSNGHSNGNGNGYSRTVFISLHESVDSGEDVQTLNDVKKLLLEYPGSDHVNLTIQTEQGQLRMDWPLVNTSYCEDLQTALDELLGAGAVYVADTRPNGN